MTIGVGIGVGNAVGTVPDAMPAGTDPAGHVPGAGPVGCPSNLKVTPLGKRKATPSWSCVKTVHDELSKYYEVDNSGK
jgi:hypothetical protein